MITLVPVLCRTQSCTVAPGHSSTARCCAEDPARSCEPARSAHPLAGLTPPRSRSRAVGASSAFPDRGRQMVLRAQPSTQSLSQPRPRREARPRHQHAATPPERGSVFHLNPASLGGHDTVWPCLFWTMLGSWQRWLNTALQGGHNSAKNPALKDTQVLETSTTAY